MSRQRHDTRSVSHRPDEFDLDQEVADDDLDVREPFDLRGLLRLHPRLLLAALIVAVLMVPVGIFLAALGVWVLDISGGAARDTSIVVGMAGYLVSDFWGGGIVATLTRARAPQVAIAWGLARLLVLVLVAIAAPSLAPMIPVQLALAVPAAWAGARTARKQASLRRQIERERDQAEAEAAGGGDGPDSTPDEPRTPADAFA
jgi:hypothetical protein